MKSFLVYIVLVLIVCLLLIETEPQTVTVYEKEYVPCYTQTIMYVPEPYPVEVPVPYEVEVPVYLEKIVETPTEYKDWTSINEFIEWYGSKDFSVMMPSEAYTVDCNDYAARVQREAVKDGYAVSQILLKDTDYYGVLVRVATDDHAACMIMIRGASGDHYYYIEPNPRYFKVIYLIRRD